MRLTAPIPAMNGPQFDQEVRGDGGYVWWYVDALSDDGLHGLTMIAFIGSVFSPYYAWSNWVDPLQHCAINVALYRLDSDGGPLSGKWAMTERGAKFVSRDATHFTVGPSGLRWEDGVLVADIEEITFPLPSRLTGTIRLTPEVQTSAVVTLDSNGRHIWRPLAPRARVDLGFKSPALKWSGAGYFDSNHGDEPLERAFQSWHWGRAHRDHDIRLYYDVAQRDGIKSDLALKIGHDGSVEQIATPPTQALKSTFWQIDRTAWSDQGTIIEVVKTLEDTPFYARSALKAQIEGEATIMMHESLNLDRIKSPIVRAMLPFRMPRRNF